MNFLLSLLCAQDIVEFGKKNKTENSIASKSILKLENPTSGPPPPPPPSQTSEERKQDMR